MALLLEFCSSRIIPNRAEERVPADSEDRDHWRRDQRSYGNAAHLTVLVSKDEEEVMAVVVEEEAKKAFVERLIKANARSGLRNQLRNQIWIR